MVGIYVLVLVGAEVAVAVDVPDGVAVIVDDIVVVAVGVSSVAVEVGVPLAPPRSVENEVWLDSSSQGVIVFSWDESRESFSPGWKGVGVGNLRTIVVDVAMGVSGFGKMMSAILKSMGYPKAGAATAPRMNKPASTTAPIAPNVNHPRALMSRRNTKSPTPL